MLRVISLLFCVVLGAVLFVASLVHDYGVWAARKVESQALRELAAAVGEIKAQASDETSDRRKHDMDLLAKIDGVADSQRRTTERIEARIATLEVDQVEHARQIGRLDAAEKRLAAIERPRPSTPKTLPPAPTAPRYEWRIIGGIAYYGYQDGPTFRYFAPRTVPSPQTSACTR